MLLSGASIRLRLESITATIPVCLGQTANRKVMIIPHRETSFEVGLPTADIAEVLRGAVETSSVWWLRTFVHTPGKKYVGWVSEREFRLKPVLEYQDGGYGPFVYGQIQPSAEGTRVFLNSRAPLCAIVMSCMLALVTLAIATANLLAAFSVGTCMVVLHLVGLRIFSCEAKRVESGILELLKDKERDVSRPLKGL